MSSDPCQAIEQIEHIALATNDVESLRDFHVLVGAMASPLSTVPGTDLRRCVLDFCGVQLELFEQPHSRQGPAGDAPRPVLLYLGFALESADAVDELTCAIAAAGHRVLQPPQRTGELGRYESIVLEPDGNQLKLELRPNALV